MIADEETAFAGGSAMSVSPDSVVYYGKPLRETAALLMGQTLRDNL
jgi:hypothetical protein